MVTYRESIAIAQVIFYVPSLTGGIFLALRHGFSKSSGWVLLITFSTLRLIGAILEIVGIHHPTEQVITGATVCTSIGLSPLILMGLGLMSRVNDSVGEPIPNKIYRGIHLGGVIALCLGIYGGTKQATSNTSDYTHVNGDSKAAVILFTVIFVISFFIFLTLLARLKHAPSGEKRLLLAIGLSWPFLTVRYIYALVTDFGQNKNFNSYSGSPTIYLVMAVLIEFIVVVIYEIVGFTLQIIHSGGSLNISEIEMPVRSRGPHSEDEYTPQGNRLTGHIRWPKRQARGPISWLYLQAKQGFQSHAEVR